VVVVFRRQMARSQMYYDRKFASILSYIGYV
jgi:hypothetical protein